MTSISIVGWGWTTYYRIDSIGVAYDTVCRSSTLYHMSPHHLPSSVCHRSRHAFGTGRNRARAPQTRERVTGLEDAPISSLSWAFFYFISRAKAMSGSSRRDLPEKVIIT